MFIPNIYTYISVKHSVPLHSVQPDLYVWLIFCFVHPEFYILVPKLFIFVKMRLDKNSIICYYNHAKANKNDLR